MWGGMFGGGGNPDLHLQGQGLMIYAMAMRIKFRKHDHDGIFRKVPLPVMGMGAHKKNRGGQYPAGVRCKSLCSEVLEAGFLKEEVNHCCVVVEEIPVEQALRNVASGILSGKDRYTSGSAYNIECCSRDELLVSCFRSPYDVVRHNLLSHNHMMLVMRGFLTGAKWDIPADAEKGVTCCDVGGGLSVTAVAATLNGKELAEVLAEGISCEVLSCKRDLEEPDAAGIISAALNQPASLAMHTTELTAVAVLKGEIIVQMGRSVSERVAFQTV